MKFVIRNTLPLAALAATAISLATPAQAGGLVGDVFRAVGLKSVGDSLDNAHRDLKKKVPIYGHAEETISGAVRHTGRQFRGEVGGRVIEQWIYASRSDARHAGVRPIPADIKRRLRGFFPDGLLNRVRYRIGQGNDLGLPASSFRFGDAVAITLGDIIVFRHGSGPRDVKLWAHELAHVEQYDRWGIAKFARKYARDHGAIERDAERRADKFVSWQRRQPSRTVRNVAPQRRVLSQSRNVTPRGRFQARPRIVRPRFTGRASRAQVFRPRFAPGARVLYRPLGARRYQVVR